MLSGSVTSSLFGFCSISFVTLPPFLIFLMRSIFADVLNTNLTKYAFSVRNVLINVTIDVLFRLAIYICASRSTF
jgi:hypothetical protein